MEKNINIYEFPHYFDKLFRGNLDRRKLVVVSTYFFRRNFQGGKIDVITMSLFRRNFDRRKFQAVSMYLFDAISMHKNRHNFDMLILMRFWKIKHGNGFDIFC